MLVHVPPGCIFMAKVSIGCAGWSIPRGHRALFAKGDSALARYATRFDVVEINSSFYRSHRHDTYQRWAASVPAKFRFAVKLPRTITHEAALHRAGPLLDQFMGEVAGLGGKLGRLLVQLPPSQALDARVASTFFRMLRNRTDVAVACEPRHPSWFTPAAEALFARNRIVRVIADPAIPATEAGMPGRRQGYWRMHGTPRMYYSAYTEVALRSLARRLRSTRDAWVIFDNTAHGHAVADAARLQAMLDTHASAPGRPSTHP